MAGSNRVPIEEAIGMAENRMAPSSGGAFVTMMKTTDTRPSYHLPLAGAAPSLFRSLFLKAAVGAILMVVLDIRKE